MGFATAATVAGMAMSAYQANKAGKAAKEQADKQAQQMGFANDLARQQWEQEQAMYKPIKEKLVKEAMSDTPVGYGRQVGEIERAYGEARKKLESPYGYGSGIGASRAQALDIGEAAAKSGAWGQAEDRSRALMMQLAAGDRSGQYGQNYQQSVMNQANFSGNLAAQYGQGASAGWGAVAAGLGQLGSMYGKKSEEPKVESDIIDPNKPSVQTSTYYPAQNLQPIQPWSNPYSVPSLTPPGYSVQPAFQPGFDYTIK